MKNRYAGGNSSFRWNDSSNSGVNVGEVTMNFIRQNWKGLLLCLVLAAPASLFGKQFPIIGGPVFAILGGMIFAPLVKKKESFAPGIKYTSKKICSMRLCF